MMPASVMLFLATFALMFYILGATFVEAFVNYRSWRFIGAAEFSTYHRIIGRRVLAFVAFPVVLSLMGDAALLRFRPLLIPTWCLWSTLILTVVAIAISVTLQIPIQLELDREGLAEVRINRLISIEWFRFGAHVGNAILFLWMIAISLRDAR